MDIKKSKRLLAILAVAYWMFAIGIYAIAHEQFRYTEVTGKAPESKYIIGEVVDGMEIQQHMVASSDLLDGVEILVDTYSRTNSGILFFTLKDLNDNTLAQTSIDVGDLINCQYTFIPFGQKIAANNGETLILTLSTQGCSSGNAVTIYAGKNLPSDVQLDISTSSDVLYLNGFLCVRLHGYNSLIFYKLYWVVVSVAFLLLVCYTVICWKAAIQGKANPLVSLLTVFTRYSFLIKQLVARDFKSKYKRSTLGMAWSVLNPLLTMSVQYFVFSTLFNSNIPNYPVYLLTGIVFFNFFNEAISLGMTSITSNASLIKKVYMPKYIYPLSRILSSLVNFILALIPLFLVILGTRTQVSPAMLLLIFDILCFLTFLIGLTLLLTTAMTFFQDTQYLWSVASLMWQYLTPIFYPETIIPEKILPFYRLNPMYQFISFARTCIIDGISPAPEAYCCCLISAVITLLAGIVVFKKHQNKFVLYL